MLRLLAHFCFLRLRQGIMYQAERNSIAAPENVTPTPIPILALFVKLPLSSCVVVAVVPCALAKATPVASGFGVTVSEIGRSG